MCHLSLLSVKTEACPTSLLAFIYTQGMRTLNLKITILLMALVASSASAAPVCRDADAKSIANEAALDFFRKQGEIFRPAKVFKVHSPSRFKEVGSYVKIGKKQYSIFTLVSPDCEAHFIKRTRQGPWPG